MTSRPDKEAAEAQSAYAAGRTAAEALRRDGAAVVRGVVPARWIAAMRDAVDQELAAPSPTGAEYGREAGRFYGDFFLWRRSGAFREFALRSPLPALAAGLLGGEGVNLFYDQLFVKEPGSIERTPWHQDLPYWPVAGTQVVSVWVPFDAAGPENGVVTYVKGSHAWGRRFRPQPFDARNAAAFAPTEDEAMPDVEADPERFPLISWRLQPGDVLVHLGLTIHGAPGNLSTDRRRRALALRYAGDDARYDPRPGTFFDMESVRAHVSRPEIAAGAPIGGRLFPRAWPPSDIPQGRTGGRAAMPRQARDDGDEAT